MMVCVCVSGALLTARTAMALCVTSIRLAVCVRVFIRIHLAANILCVCVGAMQRWCERDGESMGLPVLGIFCVIRISCFR